ncbi:MAG: hypothetical protein JNL65_11445 [Saprospiraceae bacterium]|nr:hypothetical protein [Saprospiraceae bacterium]
MQELPPKANRAPTGSKPDDLNVLQNIWEQSFDRLHSVSTKDKIDQILNITALKDIEYLKKYLQLHENELKPEEKYFIEMSIRLKKYSEPNKGLIEGQNISSNNSISDEDFQNFVSSNFISKSNLESIARKIIDNKMLAPRELAIYSEKSNEIESLIINVFNKN